eukprot:365399-Chlamydomonas_euryale.AAC.1
MPLSQLHPAIVAEAARIWCGSAQSGHAALAAAVCQYGGGGKDVELVWSWCGAGGGRPNLGMQLSQLQPAIAAEAARMWG